MANAVLLSSCPSTQRGDAASSKAAQPKSPPCPRYAAAAGLFFLELPTAPAMAGALRKCFRRPSVWKTFITDASLKVSASASRRAGLPLARPFPPSLRQGAPRKGFRRPSTWRTFSTDASLKVSASASRRADLLLARPFLSSLRQGGQGRSPPVLRLDRRQL